MDPITCQNCNETYMPTTTKCPTCFMDRTEMDRENLDDYIEEEKAKQGKSRIGTVISVILIIFAVVRIIIRMNNN